MKHTIKKKINYYLQKQNKQKEKYKNINYVNTKNYFLYHYELLIIPINKINSIHIESMNKITDSQVRTL